MLERSYSTSNVDGRTAAFGFDHFQAVEVRLKALASEEMASLGSGNGSLIGLKDSLCRPYYDQIANALDAFIIHGSISPLIINRRMLAPLSAFVGLKLILRR